MSNGILNVNCFKVGQKPFSGRDKPKKAKRLEKVVFLNILMPLY